MYCKVFNYTINDAPFPWKDDRVRSGKYKSSQSAFDEYHKSLNSLSGKIYKLEKYVVYDGIPGLVFSDTGGNQFFFTIDLLLLRQNLWKCPIWIFKKTIYLTKSICIWGKTIIYHHLFHNIYSFAILM
jgi:hypothetical protein